MLKQLGWMAVLMASANASNAVAKDEPPPQAPVMREVLDCRALTEASARLACFDRTVAALDQAQQRKDIVVADKASIREARRGLFGFTLPRIRLFGDDDIAGPDAVTAIDAKIGAVGENGGGGLLLTLDNGARWTQIDSDFIRRPSVGQSVIIRRGPVGGYMAKIEGGRAFRTRRLSE